MIELECVEYFWDGNISGDKSELTRGKEVGDDVGGDMSRKHLTMKNVIWVLVDCNGIPFQSLPERSCQGFHNQELSFPELTA